MIVYEFEEKLIEGYVLRRVNKFLVEVFVEDKRKLCHLHDPGRLKDLIYEGNKVLIRSTKGKKTDCSITAAFSNNRWVLCDSRLHNKIALKFLPSQVRSEVNIEGKRIDFFYDKTFVEVKGCTLVKEGVALFPDAPTKRGTQHLELLIKLINSGFKAKLMFLVMRDDAYCFKPNWETDKSFSLKFREAVKNGVEVEIKVFRLISNKIEYVTDSNLCDKWYE